jgi:GH25 family lysozyme M1 (1,4-beta-N-acetylmuramidase)
VVLYCNRHFWLNVDTTSYAGDALWIADYVSAGKPRIKAKWRFHQYTDDPLDKNVADFESKAALRKWAEDA